MQLVSSAGVFGHVGTDARRMGSFGGAVQQVCSAGVKLAGVGGRAAGTGRHAKRAEARAERAEAGSVSFGHDSDVLLSCRVESPSSRVARVDSALHNLCLVHSSSIPAQFTRAYVSCTMCGEFGGRHRRWRTSFLCT